MLDLSVIILTYNEELHIQRCIENVLPMAKDIFIIDSFSTDRTLEIARKYPHVHILQNKWGNNYAKQFNWGLEHAPIHTQWVLRLDADEYLLPELIEELQEKLPSLPDDVSGIIFKRRHIRAVEFNHDFCDHNLNDLSWFCHKHVNYAIREAVDLLDIELDLTGAAETDEKKQISGQAKAKRMMKHRYAKQPLFWRAFAYFCYRYFFKLGFTEGKEGFLWHFLQGWWYRTLVDAKVFEIKKACGNDKEKIRRHLKDNYGIEL